MTTTLLFLKSYNKVYEITFQIGKKPYKDKKCARQNIEKVHDSIDKKWFTKIWSLSKSVAFTCINFH